jgi:hypothetical protein
LALLAGVVSLAGCRGPRLWVPGLTLPPYAQVVSREEGASLTLLTEQGLPRPTLGRAKAVGVLIVSFDDRDGWQAVIRYIEPRLAKQGYVDSLRQVQGLMSDLTEAYPGSGAWRENAEAGIFDLTRRYVKRGGEYQVSLTDMKRTRELAGVPATAQPPPGQFVLVVVKLKREE